MSVLDKYLHTSGPIDPAESAPPIPRLVVPETQTPPPLPSIKVEYHAFSAPVNERREWLYMLTRTGGHEVLRYELLNKMLFSPDGSQLVLIYVDTVYLLKGQKLVELLPKLMDRHVYFVDEYDSTRHLSPDADFSCRISSIESFPRNASQGQQAIDRVQTSKR